MESITCGTDGTVVLPIPGHPGYFADTEGRVWSSHRGRWGKRYTEIHLMRASLSSHGYPCVVLKRGSGRSNQPVHRLVAAAFLGPRPRGLVICHRNNDRADSRPSNLMYVTQRENVRQAVEQGRMVSGDRSHLAKLTDAQAREILRRLQEGETQTSLAKEFGVVVSTIWALKTGRIRKHLAIVPQKEISA